MTTTADQTPPACEPGCTDPPPAHDASSRAALRLEYLTIGYNVVEGIVCVALGLVTSGLAILAFGIDSFIEVSASLVMVWRLRARGSPADLERAEHTARRAIAVCFHALAAYIAIEAGHDLWHAEAPDRSLAAVLIAAASAVAMPVLARLKRRLALRMGMASLASEAMQTAICGYLSLILLAALAVYQVTGWWWVDAVGALAMVPIIVREGVSAWRGRSCGCHG